MLYSTVLGSYLVNFDVNTRLIQFQNTPSSLVWSVRLAVKTLRRIHAWNTSLRLTNKTQFDRKTFKIIYILLLLNNQRIVSTFLTLPSRYSYNFSLEKLVRNIRKFRKANMFVSMSQQNLEQICVWFSIDVLNNPISRDSNWIFLTWALVIWILRVLVASVTFVKLSWEHVDSLLVPVVKVSSLRWVWFRIQGLLFDIKVSTYKKQTTSIVEELTLRKSLSPTDTVSYGLWLGNMLNVNLFIRQPTSCITSTLL